MSWWRRLVTWWTLRRQPPLVRVHMKGDDPSITGFLLGRRDGHYVLGLAKLHQDTDTEVPLEGETLVPCGNVFIIQRLVAVAS